MAALKKKNTASKTVSATASSRRANKKKAASEGVKVKKTPSKTTTKKKIASKKASTKKASVKQITSKKTTAKKGTQKKGNLTAIKTIKKPAQLKKTKTGTTTKVRPSMSIAKKSAVTKSDSNWSAAQMRAKRDLKNTANNTNVDIASQPRVPTYGGRPIPTEKHALAKMFLPLVNDVAAHISRRLPAHVLYEDLLSAGHFGLASAIDRFDPERRETFKGYAEFRIRGAIKDELRRQDMMSRDARIESKAVKRRIDALELKLGRKPSDDEVAELLEVSLKEYRAMQLKLISVQVVSSECFYVSDNRELPEDIASKNELKERIESALSMLPTRQADIVRKIYLEDQPLKDIAANMNVSSSRVCQIRNDAAKKLKGLLSDFRPTGS